MNKQIFFAVAAIILGSVSANAQNKGDVELGIGFGVQMSADYDNNSKSSKYLDLKSLGAGISAEYYLSEDWGIKMKVLYDPKGWSSTYTPSVIGLSLEEAVAISHKRANNQLNYLTIPIMANWHFGKNKNWYLNFGPYFGFLLDNEGSTLE